MIRKTYRTHPFCALFGHLMDEAASFPTCRRTGCDEGMQMVDYYLTLEERDCRCRWLPDGRLDLRDCPWHGMATREEGA